MQPGTIILKKMDASERHLRLLTETIEAVNSTLDLDEVLSLVASKVAAALRSRRLLRLPVRRACGRVRPARDARDAGGGDDSYNRGCAPGRGSPARPAASREPIMIAEKAHLRATFQGFPEPPRGRIRVDSRRPHPLRGEKLAGALNVGAQTRSFSPAEVDLLLAIAAQVAQPIEHAKLYREARRRVGELEALARISEAVSESLYLEESLEAIVKTTMEAQSARPGPRSSSRTARSRGRRAARARTTCACRCGGEAADQALSL